MAENALLMERLHLIKGIDAVADAFDGTVTSDIVSMRNWRRVLFLVHAGVGVTGTSTITVEACDDVAATNAVAIPFHYRQILSGDTEGTITAATAVGFATTAGSSKLIAVEVRDDALAASGYEYVRLKAVEVVNSPVLGGILILGESLIATSDAKPTAIV